MLRVQDYSLGIRVGVKGSRQRRTFDLRLQPGSTKLVQVRFQIRVRVRARG